MALDPVLDAFWRVDPPPDGSRAPDGPVVESLEDKLELIAGGGAVAAFREHAPDHLGPSGPTTGPGA
jgi:hypothetical protein